MVDPLFRRPDVTKLIDGNRTIFQAVPPDPTYAIEVLDGVVESELDLVMVGTHRGRHTKSLTLAYDAARKTVEAVMLASGVRVGRGEGGHRAVTDFAEGEFIDSTAEQRDARAFATARIARHADEYPRPGDVERSTNELRMLTQACARMVGHCRVRLGLDPRADLVPTDAKVETYLSNDS